MKKAPYKEIIDMKAEQKEYALLCEGKSKKFKVYSEWEDHIKDLLAKFHTLKDLYNERTPLYEKYADITVPLNGQSIKSAVEEIARRLQ